MTDIVKHGGISDVEGLEDLDQGDLVVPRLNIDHPLGQFVHSLTKQSWPTVDVVLLGLVKQRVMWPPTMGDGETPPMCKSLDFDYGNPGPDFPWSALDDRAAVVGATRTFSGVNTFRPGMTELPCADCVMKEWGSHPAQDNRQWCREQYVFPLMLIAPDGEFSPAILTCQGVGIKPAKTYLAAFNNAKKPLYTAITTLTLSTDRRGTVTYSTPHFARTGDTETEDWPEFSQTRAGVTAFLKAKPIPRDAPAITTTISDAIDPTPTGAYGRVAEAGTPTTPPPAPTPPTPPTPPPPSPTKPVPVAVTPDDELPF